MTTADEFGGLAGGSPEGGDAKRPIEGRLGGGHTSLCPQDRHVLVHTSRFYTSEFPTAFASSACTHAHIHTYSHTHFTLASF
jgi:hypothetical protein